MRRAVTNGSRVLQWNSVRERSHRPVRSDEPGKPMRDRQHHEGCRDDDEPDDDERSEGAGAQARFAARVLQLPQHEVSVRRGLCPAFMVIAG